MSMNPDKRSKNVDSIQERHQLTLESTRRALETSRYALGRACYALRRVQGVISDHLQRM